MNGPLDIGVQIWQGCKTQLQDKPTDETVQILRTFCDAYQGEILQKCKLSDLLVLNNYEEQINVKIWMTKFAVHVKSLNYVLYTKYLQITMQCVVLRARANWE